MIRLGDQTNRTGGHHGLPPDPGGERDLVAGPKRDPGVGDVAAAGGVDQVDAVASQLVGEPDRLIGVPVRPAVARFTEPVGRRDPEQDRQLGRSDGTDGVGQVAGEADPVVE